MDGLVVGFKDGLSWGDPYGLILLKGMLKFRAKFKSTDRRPTATLASKTRLKPGGHVHHEPSTLQAKSYVRGLQP